MKLYSTTWMRSSISSTQSIIKSPRAGSVGSVAYGLEGTLELAAASAVYKLNVEAAALSSSCWLQRGFSGYPEQLNLVTGGLLLFNPTSRAPEDSLSVSRDNHIPCISQLHLYEIKTNNRLQPHLPAGFCMAGTEECSDLTTRCWSQNFDGIPVQILLLDLNSLKQHLGEQPSWRQICWAGCLAWLQLASACSAFLLQLQTQNAAR